MTPVVELRVTDIAAYSLGAWFVYKLLKFTFSARSRGVQTSPLRGPPSPSLLFGLSRVIRNAEDVSVLTEQWANEYGSAFRVPIALGSGRIVIIDPKAVTHFYSKETFGYVQTPLARVFIERLFGRGILWAEGESHRRQRKALSPAFSNAAIRKLTSVFYDSSYKLKDNWDAILDSASGDAAVIDVQKWMNHVSLDSIGIAGFSHDFGSLDGKVPAVARIFESLQTGTSALSLLVFLLGSAIPILLKLPTSDNARWSKLHDEMRQIANDLLERTRQEKERDSMGSGDDAGEKSIIGLLIKAESANAQLQMSHEEIIAQASLSLRS
ncbi:hypothetical protein C0991_010037 [Blastosporella zonata]|nr:hypothetical protein C0991_010037 [Blastosporella zonata]